MGKKINILIPLLFLLIFPAFGQKKFEQEIRIHSKEVPQNALQVVDYFNLSKKKVKWYREIGIGGSSIEAKLPQKPGKYSIEFSADGIFEDIEVDIPYTSITALIKNKLSHHLDSLFNTYTVEKTQAQYSGDPQIIAQKFNSNMDDHSIQIKYELVVNTKLRGTFKQYECLFSEQGDLNNFTEIFVC